MKNIPKRIYLQISDEPLEKDFDFNDIDSEHVTWCSERVYDSDIEYFQKKQLKSEEIPEFQKSIDNMSQESKDKVDKHLEEIDTTMTKSTVTPEEQPKKIIVSVKKWTIKDKFYCTNCGKQVMYPQYTCTPCNIKIQPVINF